MQLYVDIEGSDERPRLPRDGADLVALMSFAAMRGFGAEHPLLALAERLQIDHNVRMGPITTFYEGKVEDVEDEEKLDMAWQDAGGLLASLEATAAALGADERCREMVAAAGVPGLADQVRALAVAIREAASSGRLVRLSYAL